MLIPEAILCHYSAGRIRIRITLKKADKSYFSRIQNLFQTLAGIKEVKSNPISGSLLLITNLTADSIFDYALKNQLFSRTNTKTKETTSHKLNTEKTNSANILKQLADYVYIADFKIKRSTNGTLDLTTITFGAFIGFGLYQIAKGQILASGSSLLVTAIALLPLRKMLDEHSPSRSE